MMLHTIGLALMLPTAVPTAWALPDRLSPRAIELRRWAIEDGLPQNSVNDIIQDANHHLWLATFGGLAQFDGTRFRTYDLAGESGLPTNRLLSLALHPEGGLIIGTQDEGLLRFQDGHFSAIPIQGAPRDFLTTDITVEGGQIWAGADAGLIDVTQGVLIPLPDPRAPSVRAVMVDSAGVVWFGGGAGLFRLENGQPQLVLSDVTVDGLLEEAPGRLLVHSSAGIRRITLPPAHPGTAEGWPRLRVVSDEDLGWYSDMALSPSGRPFVTGIHGMLGWVDEDGLRHMEDDLRLEGLLGRALHFDHRGSAWIGSIGGGLVRLRNQRIERWSRRDGLPDTLDALAHLPEAAGGGVLLAGRQPSLTLWRDGQATPLTLELRDDGPPLLHAHTLRVVGDDTVLVAGRKNLIQLQSKVDDGQATGRRLCTDLDTKPAALLPVTPEGDGTDGVWIGTERGLLRCHPDGTITEHDALMGMAVLALHHWQGGLLLGTQAGAARLDADDTLTWMRAADLPTMPAGPVRAIAEDARGVVWFGSYGGGLSRWDGSEARRFTTADGLRENTISSIIFDEHGRLLLSGNRGITVVDRDALEQVAVDRSEVAHSMLLQGGEVAGGARPTSSLGPDGELWTVTIGGASRVPPGELDGSDRSRIGPTVGIEQALLDGAPITSGALASPSDLHSLHVRLSVDSLERPGEVTYLHRLKGMDDTWKPLAGAFVEYPSLPPGSYLLQLRAVSALSPAPGPPTELAFRIEKALWQRSWFGYLIFLAISALGAAIFSMRLRTARSHSRALHQQIQQREAAEQELRRSEELYRAVFQGSTTGLAIYRTGQILEAVNPEAARLLGVSTASRDLRHGLLPHVVHSGDRAAVEDMLSAVSAQAPASPLEVQWSPRSGHERTVQIICWSITTGDDGRILVALDDVTELRRTVTLQSEMQERIHRAQTVEALAQLAGETAHDFNNLLTVVMANANLLCIGEVEDAQDIGEEILRTCTRATHLVRRILAIGQRQHWESVPVDLVSRLHEIRPLLRAALPTDIILTLRIDAAAPRVATDPAFLERALLNLLINARDALPEGGTIEIHLEEVVLDALALDELAESRLEPGRVVRLSVRDDGLGISPAVQDQIFNPFFTTKQAHEGTGLGLSSVQAFANRSGGTVGVTTAPGQGASFSLYLPMLEADATRATRTRTQAAAMVAEVGEHSLEGWRVLIVDDDVDVLRVSASALVAAGANVLQSSDPVRALELAVEHGDALDLMVTDVIMPTLRGPALVERAREAHPRLAVLYISGHTRGELPTGAPLLGKPFRTKDLVAAVLATRESSC